MNLNELHLRVIQEQYRDRLREAEKARLIRQQVGNNKESGFFQVGWLLLIALLIYIIS
jgi:hypothetical protein